MIETNEVITTFDKLDLIISELGKSISNLLDHDVRVLSKMDGVHVPSEVKLGIDVHR